jgi:NTE family protein
MHLTRHPLLAAIVSVAAFAGVAGAMLAASSPAHAADGPGATYPQSAGPHPAAAPRIVLVLSGGGARGGAHIGVLRALEELHIPVHGIVGTSMGAVVGGLYAAGRSPEELERLAVGIDWAELFTDDPARAAFQLRYKQQDDKLLVRAASGVDAQGIRLPQGYLRGHKVKALFTRNTLQVADIDNFADLPIAFAAVASDITTGDAVLLDHGDLAESLFASMAIPALVTPQKLDGRLLVDGGVANNLPVDVALTMGADVVIAVDVSSPMYEQKQLSSLLTVTDQLTNLLTRKNTQARIDMLRSQDLLISPVLSEVTSIEFTLLDTVITAGYRAVQERATDLAHLAVPEAEFTAFLEHQRRPRVREIEIREIEVASDSSIDSDRLAAQLGLETGRAEVSDVEAAADRLYGLGLFGEVPYQFRDGRLTMKPVRKAWGPNYLRFGFGLEDDLDGRSHYRLGVALTATELDRAGAEWRSEVYLGDRPTVATEFHQPFGQGGAWYVRPRAGWVSYSRPIYADDEELAEFQIRQTGLGVAAGRMFGTTTDARLELFSARGSRERNIGDPSFRGGDADSGSISAQLLYDGLDDMFFPRVGGSAAFRWLRSDDGLGADGTYESWSVDLTKALAAGPHALVLSAEYDSVYDGRAPFHEAYTLGGFFRLSGLAVDAKLGQHRALNRAAYYYRVQERAIFPIYFGASLETGQVWPGTEEIDLGDLDAAGSLFVGIDSPFGPVYLGAGMAEEGEGSLYIFLGQPF